MHAYLIVGQDEEGTSKKALGLAEKLGKQNFEFSVSKIDQVRELSRFVKLSVNIATTIILKDVDEATEEALNAFLKQLEEPQKNLTYILTARSEYKVIPTISSRCQVIKVKSQSSKVKNENIQRFLADDVGRKFSEIDALRKREEAVEFMEKVIDELHSNLHNSTNQAAEAAKLKLADKTLWALKANGNIGLQLTNFAIGLSEFSGLPEAKKQV